MLMQFVKDEAGFIVSSELALVATLLVVGMIVGLSEVQHSVVNELNDVGEAIGKLNQSYRFSGFSKNDGMVTHAFTRGSFFVDTAEACDCNQCQIDCDAPVREGLKFGGRFGGGFGGFGGNTCAGNCGN